MRWEKQGLIYRPDGSLWWARSHAAIPTPMLLDEDRIRVYIACRDEHNVSRIGYVDVNAEDPGKVLEVAREPVLDIGEPGMFDDNGVLPTMALRVNSREVRLYYFAFQLGVKVPYYMFTGLALSDDGGDSFHRYSRVPILDRTETEPFVRTGNSVMVDNGVWKMWYVGGGDWIKIGDKMVPTYKINMLTSKDGIIWDGPGRLCIDFRDDDEFGLGRPWVIRSAEIYQMFFSMRGRTSPYRLGYAVSKNGEEWTRLDEEVGIETSSHGWDSEEICFASVIKVKGNTFMFYNGNNFGETGFGYAVLADS